jgi:hypothetical protein
MFIFMINFFLWSTSSMNNVLYLGGILHWCTSLFVHVFFSSTQSVKSYSFHKISSFSLFFLILMFYICLFLFTPNQTKNRLLHIKHFTYNNHIDNCEVSKFFYKIIGFMMDIRTKYVEHQFQFSNSICDEHAYIRFHSCVLKQPFQC